VFTAILGFLPLGKLMKFIPGKGGAVIVLVAFLAGAGGSWYVKSQFEAADRAHALQDALDRQHEAVKLAITQSEALRALDQEILSQVTEQEVQIRETTKYIIEQVEVYVPVESECSPNYSVGAVRLLNQSRRPGAASNLQGLPDTPGFSDEESRAPSTITQRAEIEAHIDCAARYNQLKAKHDALIDWIHKNQKQTGDSWK